MSFRSRPNFLWISLEDTGPYLGCYNDLIARTPNIDHFATEGCRWTNCFSTSGVCAPARSAIITGMYPISIGTHHMRTTHVNPSTPEMPTPYSAVLPHYVKCFTEYLRADDYFCTNNVKTDYQFESPLTAWDELGEKAHWRNREDPKKPFFSVFNLNASHESGTWPENCPELEYDPDNVQPPPYLPNTPIVREAMARMYTHITQNDRRVGGILDQLHQDGLAQNTYVFLWSDHGPLPRGKRWPYDAGIRVPLIVRGPDLSAGQISEKLVSTIDLGPTVLSLAKVDIPMHLQGQAFLGKGIQPPREYIYASRDRHDLSYDMVRAVRDHRYKYIRNYRPEIPYLSWIPYLNRHPIMQEIWRLYLADKLDEGSSVLFQFPRPVEELYDTKTDPHEICNLAKDPKKENKLNKMRNVLDTWLQDVGDMGQISENEMVQNWYPNGFQPETAPVVCIPIGPGFPGIEPVQNGDVFTPPMVVQLHCATQGASIAYTLRTDENPYWQLYTVPIRLGVGQHVLKARAIRIGYKESQEIQQKFTVRKNE